jgi:hypothetical protein
MAQQRPPTFRLWQLTSYSGSIGVNGFYRQQERTVNDIIDYSTFPFITGNLLLNTTSYIGHPNLFLLEVGGEYNPGSSQQTYTVSPDRSEVLTFTRLNLRGTLFSGKPMNLSANFSLSRNFINREYVTSLRTDARQWGLNYNFNNKILPLSVTYSDRKWDQLELETSRTYRNKQEDLQARVHRSFTKFGDNSELRYVYYTFFREDQNLIQTNTINSQFILNNTFYFDKHKRYIFRSAINTLDQQGNVNQQRFQMFESINFNLPYQLRFTGNYDFTNLSQETQASRQHRINVGLEHQLFASLRTGISYEFYNTDHTAFKETNTRYGINLNYIKKIPTGSLNLGYSLRRHNQNMVSDPNSILQIIDEPHVLADGQVVLLDRPYVELATVVVKDVTGAIIYQRDFDYLLFERNEFVEIVRIPGGQIANSGPVLVDYIATQVGSYNFDADFQSFNVSVNLFDHLVELYYNSTIQDYSNVEESEFLTLNYFIRNVYGTRFQLGMFTAGAEWDDYNSTIVPYQKMRFYLRMSGKLGKRTLLSLNGDFSDLMLTENNIEQLYASTYGKVVYQIKAQSKINLDLGYRKQVGEEIDLDLITAKIEYNTVFRNLYMKVGAEVYKRNYVGEKLNFRGIYFRIDRRF